MRPTSIYHKAGQTIKSHPAITLSLLALLSLLGGYGALQSTVDNSLPVWQSTNDPHWKRYQEFIHEHNIQDPLLIYLQEATTQSIEPLTESLEQITQVDHIYSLNVRTKSGGTSVLLSLFPDPGLVQHELSLLLNEVSTIIARADVHKVHLGGVWFLTDRLDSLSARSTQTMFPLVIGLLAGTLLLLLRQMKNFILIMACGLLPGLQLTGFIALSGNRMNMILLALPPLTMILGISHAIHLLTKTGGGTEDPLDVFARVAPPCLLSGVTTALGFLSLTLSQYPPVKQLGLWGAVGTGLSLLTSFLLLPLFFTPATQPYKYRFLEPLLTKIARRKKIILFGFALALLFSFIGGQQLQRGSFILDFFKQNSDVRLGYETIERDGIGLTPLEIDLGSTGFSNREIEKKFQTLAEQHPEITHILFSFSSGITVPATTRNGAEFITPTDLDFMLEDVSRLTLLTQTSASEKTLALVEQIEQFCQQQLGRRPIPYVTGSIPLYTMGQKKLFSTLILSFSAAFLSISLIMGLVLRSVRLGALAILPNILPVVFILGIMGWAGLPLSVATVTVASIVFGIVVDDTIHFLHSWQNASRQGGDQKQRLRKVFSYAGPAMITTTLVSGCGFLGFAASPFLPLRNFGLLISLAMGFALVCDIVLLPALLLLEKPDTTDISRSQS